MAALALALMVIAPTGAFQCPSSTSLHIPRHTAHSPLQATSDTDNESIITDRRSVVNNIVMGGLLGITAMTTNVQNAAALVEGNVPPGTTKSQAEEYRQKSASFGGSVEAEVLPREAYKKLSSGVVYADISVGSGEQVKEGSKVNMQWVLRRSNGYFVDSSAVSDSVPFIFTVGNSKGAIAGVDEGVRGMKAGGSRRILIPPTLAWTEGIDDGKPGPLPAGFGPRQQMRRVMKDKLNAVEEYIFLEVKVTKVR